MIKVMIADDDINVREGLAEVIDWEKLNAELICAASNGQEIIDALSIEKADLLILDINMPLMSGIDVAKYVKKNFIGVEIIFLSSYAEFEYAQEAVSAGIREYLLKPIDIQKLNHIKKIINDISCENEITVRLAECIHTTSFEDDVMRILQEENIASVEELLYVPASYSKLEIYRNYCISVFKFSYSYFKKINGAVLKDESTYLEVLLHSKNNAELKDNIIQFCADFFEKQHLDKDQIKDVHLAEEIVEFIEKNLTDINLTVQSVGKKFGYTPNYLSKYFKMSYGITIQDCISDKRLKKAKDLLANTQMTLKSIAQECGYETPRGFTKFFVNKVGITPNEYRMNVNRGAK